MDDFKSRDRHPGPSAPHLGQDHFDKDTLEAAARTIDQGPTFGTPGDPPDADPENVAEVGKAYDDLDREEGVVRPG